MCVIRRWLVLPCAPMWRGLFILLLWLLAQPGAAWAQAPVQMPLPAPLKVLAGATRLEFAGHLAMLKDVSGQLTLAQAMQSADWQPLPGEMNLGFTQAAIWLRLDLERGVTCVKPRVAHC